MLSVHLDRRFCPEKCFRRCHPYSSTAKGRVWCSHSDFIEHQLPSTGFLPGPPQCVMDVRYLIPISKVEGVAFLWIHTLKPLSFTTVMGGGVGVWAGKRHFAGKCLEPDWYLPNVPDEQDIWSGLRGGQYDTPCLCLTSLMLSSSRCRAL